MLVSQRVGEQENMIPGAKHEDISTLLVIEADIENMYISMSKKQNR